MAPGKEKRSGAKPVERRRPPEYCKVDGCTKWRRGKGGRCAEQGGYGCRHGVAMKAAPIKLGVDTMYVSGMEPRSPVVMSTTATIKQFREEFAGFTEPRLSDVYMTNQRQVKEFCVGHSAILCCVDGCTNKAHTAIKQMCYKHMREDRNEDRATVSDDSEGDDLMMN